MSREQSISEMEFNVAMAEQEQLADEIDRLEGVPDLGRVLTVLGNSRRKWRALLAAREIQRVIALVGRPACLHGRTGHQFCGVPGCAGPMGDGGGLAVNPETGKLE